MLTLRHFYRRPASATNPRAPARPRLQLFGGRGLRSGKTSSSGWIDTSGKTVHGNPIELLARVDQARLNELAGDDAFTSHLEAAMADLPALHAARGLVLAVAFGRAAGARIAYFSMEYGIHECLSDLLGRPRAFWQAITSRPPATSACRSSPWAWPTPRRYFRQALNTDGWQGERYPINDWHRMPVSPVFDGTGKRLVIHVKYPQG